jgi:hypothetical protein
MEPTGSHALPNWDECAAPPIPPSNPLPSVKNYIYVVSLLYAVIASSRLPAIIDSSRIHHDGTTKGRIVSIQSQIPRPSFLSTKASRRRSSDVKWLFWCVLSSRIRCRCHLNGDVMIRRHDSSASRASMCSAGATLRQISSAWRDVRLRAPEILCNAWCWIDRAAASARFCTHLKPCPPLTYHVEHAYMICGIRTAV